MKCAGVILFVLFGLAGVLMPATGCGGGGGGAAPGTSPNALFSGTYVSAEFFGDFSVPTGQARWGFFPADGAGGMGGLPSTFWSNDGAGTIDSGPAFPFTYSVDAARRFQWPGAPLNPLVSGGISADGRLVAYARVDAAQSPGVCLMGRRAGNYSLASLDDTYHLVAFLHLNGGDIGVWGTVQFHGNGTATETMSTNTNGGLGGPFAPTTQSYTVQSDGTVTYTFTPSLDPTWGGILLGGDLIVLGGATDTQWASTCIVVLIRQSGTASAATLTGSYHSAGIAGDTGTPPPHFISYTGLCSFDGVDTMTVNVGTGNLDGAVGPFPPIAIDQTYAVAGDGGLTVTTPLTTHVGAVSPTGACAAVAGGTGATTPPEFWIFVR
jgi:hypothetical protein